MEIGSSRRELLASLGVGSAALAGCTDLFDDTDAGDGNQNGGGNGDGDGNDDGNGGDSTDDDADGESVHRWPAIESGEVISDFEDLDAWDAIHGEVSAAPEEARTGSQAALLESDAGVAKMRLVLPEALDLRDWDVSLAVEPERVDRFIVEYLAPDSEHKLTCVRFPPEGHEDGWFRVDAGYEHKPYQEPDLANVTQINVVLDVEDGEPARVHVDDLRRTPAADNGKAVIAFYGGLDSHWEIGAQRLQERGWPAAVAVTPRRIGSSGRMDVDQLRQLRERGWDVSAYPRGHDLAEQSEQRQRSILESARETLEDHGFEDGARHYFSPTWREMTTTTHTVVRDVFDSGYLRGGCTSGIPPTGTHTVSAMWGPALHNGVRRRINLSDQYKKLVVIRIPPIVENAEKTSNNMSIDEFEHLLDHIETRGLDVVTPSQLIDGEFDGGGDDDTRERPAGVIFEAGQSHSFEGSGAGETGAFDLEDSVVTAAFDHAGDGAFEVRLRPQDGDIENETLIRTEGDAGDAIARVGAGTYRLEVQADGDWQVDLEQPEINADDLQDLPTNAEGDGPAAIGPLWTEDNVRLDIRYDGDGDFVVDGYGADGSWEQIANLSGEFSGGRSYGAGGVVWLNVQASGPWSIDVAHQ